MCIYLPREELPERRQWFTCFWSWNQCHLHYESWALRRYLHSEKLFNLRNNCGAISWSKNLAFYILVVLLLQISVASGRHIHQNEHAGVETRRSRNVSGGSGDSTAPILIRSEHLGVPIGGVMHLFPRYGYLSLSMRVIAKSEKSNASGSQNISTTTHAPPPQTQQSQNDRWLFLEPVNHVIEPTTVGIHESTISPHENESLPFHNLFHIDLCEDLTELLEAYFKNFSIEGLDKPWQAFSGGWRFPSISRNFGIDQNFVEGDYRYILVKVLLVRGNGVVDHLENISVSSIYQPSFQQFKADNDLSTYQFFKVVGTHYIHAYIIGNAIYQVFVYDPDGFEAVKRRLFMDGVKHQSTSEFLQQLPEIFSMFVKHAGRVFVLNSAPAVADQVRAALTVHSVYSNPVTNLFKLHNNPSLVKQIELLLDEQPNGLLGIDLRGIHFLFKDPVQRAGFEKALKHKMQLWEVNFQY